MANQRRGSNSGGDILTERPISDVLPENSNDKDTELPSEMHTGRTMPMGDQVAQGRTNQSYGRSSKHRGDGDTWSSTDRSTDVFCKRTTGNTTSSNADCRKHKPNLSRKAPSRHSVAADMTKYSSDFEQLSTTRTLKSISSLRYTDEFTPSTSSKTVRSQYVGSYSEDFESTSRTAEIATLCSVAMSDVSESVTSASSVTRSPFDSTVYDSDTTDVMESDADDDEYSSDSYRSESSSTSRCSGPHTSSSTGSGSSFQRSSCRPTKSSPVIETKSCTLVKRSRTGEPGSLHIAESHTYISSDSDDSGASSDVDYDDESSLFEDEEDEEERCEEDSVEGEAAQKAELSYVERKLHALRSAPVPRSTRIPHPPQQPSKQGLQTTQHLDDFCCHKLHLLKKRRQQSHVLSGETEIGANEGATASENEGPRHRESARCLYLGLESNQLVDAYGMSSIKVRKLRERHAMDQIRKASQTRIHVPRKCKACRNKMAELAEEEFLRAKTAKMLARLMERKFEKHVLKYSDTVGLIGELVHGLPTMQQAPGEITRKLLQPLEDRPRIVTEKTSFHSKETIGSQPDFPCDPAELWEAYMAPLRNSSWFPAKS